MRDGVGEVDQWNLVHRRKGQAYCWHRHPLLRVGDFVDVPGVRDELIKVIHSKLGAHVVKLSVRLEFSNHV